MNRRQFLRATGWAAGGLTVVAASGCSLLPALPTFGGSSETDALSWVKLDATGRVTFLLPRAEIGQGIDTGLTLVVAEELQTDPQSIECHYQNTALMAPCQMTVGSQSIENYMTLTALAAASLREVLLERAAAKLGEPVLALTCADGKVSGAAQSLRFADLVEGDEEVVLPVPVESPRLLSQNPSGRFIGQPEKAKHAMRMVTGAETYSRDVVLPGMQFGGVAKPEQLGAALLDYDAAAAKQVPGVVDVVTSPAGEVGVVAQTPAALRAGMAALNCNWQTLSAEAVQQVDAPIDVDVVAQAGDIDHTPVNEGSIETGQQAAVKTLNVRYDTPMAAHANMEPRAGVAQPLAGGLEIWTGSQDPWFVRAAVSKLLGIEQETIRVHNCRVGGAFGGRVLCQASVEAAWLANAVGVPVKVQWSREEEFRHNYAGPQFSTRVQAGLAADGSIAFWHHQMAGAPVLTSSMLVPANLHWIANIPADPGTIRGTETAYTFTHHKVETADVRVPMPTGPWRGLGAAPNTFAVECAMDELAQLGEVDPFELRRRHATNPRLKGVLDRLQTLTAGHKNLGIAATAYKGVTFVAIAAQVQKVDGGLKLTKLWCVHDCGRMVAPDRVLAQVEGNLIWGISMALHESFELQDGKASTDNFDTYAIARQTDMPEFEIELLASQAPPSGAAEAALAPAGAAIANAVSRLTGARTRQLPLRELA